MTMDPSDGIPWADKNRPDMATFRFGGVLLERNANAIPQGET